MTATTSALVTCGLLTTLALARASRSDAANEESGKARQALRTNASTARILIGPNIHVSREYAGPYMEPILAAHPTDPNTLMGVARDFGVQRDSRHKIWVSRDRGQTWRATYLPWTDNNSGDAVLAFGVTGTMLVHRSDRPVWRSDDGGHTWTAARPNDRAPEVHGSPFRTGHREYDFWTGDREHFGVDWSNGKYRGRVYLSNVGKTELIRSSDDGRTFETVVHGTPVRRWFTPLVFSDGMLAVPVELVHLDANGKPLSMSALNATGKWAMNISANGGDSFALGSEMPFEGSGDVCRARYPRWVKVRNRSNTYAVDNSRASPYANRLYVVQDECRNGVWRSRLTYSTDRGKSWSQPRLLAPDAPAGSVQFMPTVAVNKDGVVAITWYDTRHSERLEGHDLYMTASTDGGVTFLPAVRVSSVTSVTDAPGNRREDFEASVSLLDHSDSTHVWLSRGRIGDPRVVGEYMGLAADAGGIFHALWNDSRNGTYHVYAAQLRVLKPGAPVSQCDALAPGSENLNTVLRPEVDRPVYDSASRQAGLPVRLRNVSRDTLCGPLTVTLTQSKGSRDTTAVMATELVFDARALRDLNYLAPGATTEPLTVPAFGRDPSGEATSGYWRFGVIGRRGSRR